MRKANWRILTGPHILKRNAWKRPAWADGSSAPYCLDNGAWTSFQSGLPFDAESFLRTTDMLAEDADFIIVPDIVEGGLQSLHFSMSWLSRLRHYGTLLLVAVQDGMTPEDVAPLLGADVGIFLGGSTEWKLTTMRQWGKLARDIGAYFHVGRVNSMKRIHQCQLCGAHSFDGTSVTKFPQTITLLDNARKQLPLLEIL